MTSIILQWLGIISGSVVLLGLVFMGTVLIFEKLTKVYFNLIERIKFDGRKESGALLVSASYWFSEDQKTYKLLREIGTQISVNGHVDPSKIRETWRKENEKTVS